MGAGHPTAHGPGRHQPAAGHPVGGAHATTTSTRLLHGAGPAAAPVGAALTSAAASDRVRPRRLVAVVGTGTDVGKTWVSARVLRDLRAAGLRVAARKPAQSFDPGDDPGGRRRRRARRGQRRAARRRLPTAPLVRGRHGATDGGRGAGPSPVHHRRPGRRARLARAGGRRRAGRDRRRGALAPGGRRRRRVPVPRADAGPPGARGRCRARHHQRRALDHRGAPWRSAPLRSSC